MNRLYLLFLFFLIISMVQSCATANRSIIRKDPLIGKIIDAKTSESQTFDSLIRDISTYDVIYLSEKHDNPDQHHIQQRIIHHLVEEGLNPTIGFEFFAMADTPDLLNFVDAGQVNHSKETDKIIEADLRKKLGWDTRSDQMWKYYFDLLSMAKEKKLQVAGIDLTDALKKRITRKGMAGITSIEKEQVFSTQLSDPAYKTHMFSIFKAVHCGMEHERMQSRLYDTWVARNDKMALSISQLYQHQKGPIVIVIGGGHTEYGLGVMDRVTAIDETITQVNIALREISVTPSHLSEYLLPLEAKGLKKALPADFFWFTQRVSYKDPCEEFKTTLERMKKSVKK